MEDEAQVRFLYPCPQTWESFHARDRAAERWCDLCEKSVRLCATVDEARVHAGRGHCVAVPVALVREERRGHLPPLPRPVNVSVGLLVTEDLPRVAWLVPLDGPRAHETCRLDEVTEIGGGPPSKLAFADAGLAIPHVRISWTHGGYVMRALSDSDTSVAGRCIARDQDFGLVDNDVLQLGQLRLQFKTVY